MSNLDDKLEEILRGIECYQWPEDDEPTIDAVSLHQAKQAIKDCFKEWVVEVLYWLAKYKEWEMVKTEVLLAEFERQRNQGEKTDESI